MGLLSQGDANKVYSLLVRHAGAKEELRSFFLRLYSGINKRHPEGIWRLESVGVALVVKRSWRGLSNRCVKQDPTSLVECPEEELKRINRLLTRGKWREEKRVEKRREEKRKKKRG